MDATFSSLNRFGIGMCIKDDANDFVVGRTDWFSPLCELTIGEAVELHTALQWVSNLRFDDVDFVLDSVVDSFHTQVVDDSELGCIITACRQLFLDSFQNSHVKFNRRQANESLKN